MKSQYFTAKAAKFIMRMKKPQLNIGTVVKTASQGEVERNRSVLSLQSSTQSLWLHHKANLCEVIAKKVPIKAVYKYR